jgi:death-on-curing protein
LESLVQNHGFIDGNKRTAFIVTRLFLERSGYVLRGIHSPADVELEHLIVGVAGAHSLQESISDWFKRRIKPI